MAGGVGFSAVPPVRLRQAVVQARLPPGWSSCPIARRTVAQGKHYCARSDGDFGDWLRAVFPEEEDAWIERMVVDRTELKWGKIVVIEGCLIHRS